ncbi:MAG: hypothetical protein ACOYXB_07980 [Bacteroidota bacterium]
MKKFLTVIFLVVFTQTLLAQPDRIGLGLDFSTGLMFNTQKTGNPGFLAKTWLRLDKRGEFYLVPSVAAYNRYRISNGYMILKNYMFQGDLDGQFQIYREKTLKVIGFAGANFTWLISDFEPIVITGNETLTDLSDMAIGGNAGLGLEMRMSASFDFNVNGKYTMSRSLNNDIFYKQVIISVQAVYYFRARRVGAWY